MKSVAGAQFLMDWCVNAYWQPFALANWYPGDDVVDIIGIDSYDSGLPPSITTQPAAWNRLFTQPDGIQAVQSFAAQHGKPLSVPEWGLGGVGSPWFGMGDDPAYIDGMASVVSSGTVAFQSYFLGGDPATLLEAPGSQSFARYVAHFGGGGNANGSPTVTP